MTKSKVLPKISPFLILGILILALIAFFLYKISLNYITEGEILLSQGKYNEGVLKFEQAQRFWPLLKSNQLFQEKIIQNRKISQKSKLVTIILKEDTRETDRQFLISELKTVTGVKEVKYISKENALDEYKEQYKDQPDLVAIVSQSIDFSFSDIV